MIRTLATIAAVSFLLAIACFGGAFAIAGGPFHIDDGWRFHHGHWGIDDEDEGNVVAPTSNQAIEAPRNSL